MTPDEAFVVESARQKLLIGCAEHQGISSTRLGLDPPTRADGGEVRRPGGRIGALEYPAEDAVARYGYVAFFPERLGSSTSSTAPADVTSNALDARELGIASACAQTARTALTMDEYVDLYNFGSVESGALQSRVASSSDHARVLQRWRDCVAASGFVATDTPETFMESVRPTDGWVLPVPSATVTQAKVDVACRRRVSLYETEAKLLVDATDAWFDANPDYVVQVKHAVESLVARATAIVG